MANTTEIYSPTVQETRSPKSRCWQRWFLLGTLNRGGISSMPPFQWLPEILGAPWLVGGITPVSDSLFTWWFLYVPLCPTPYKDTSHWIRSHPAPVWPSAKTLFPNKVTFPGTTGVRTWWCLLGGDNSIHGRVWLSRPSPVPATSCHLWAFGRSRNF